MNWYKLAKSKLERKIEKKKEISLQKGWSQLEVDWAGKISGVLQDLSYFMWLLAQSRNGSVNIETGEENEWKRRI